MAAADLWPDGNVQKSVAVRNRAYAGWFKAQNLPMPSVRHIQRFHGGR
jgi:hypothetical protein